LKIAACESSSKLVKLHPFCLNIGDLMKKSTLAILVLALLLTACQSAASTPPETAGVTQVPAVQASTPTGLSRSTSTPTRAVETTPVRMAAASEESPGCTVQSPFPTPGPTEQSLFPPPGEKDWIKGPDSAAVTFTEYSDFQ
jgi:hypothetical protein